jgi:hypothetical protein
LALPAALQAVQFIALASGKPGEYGRFAIFLDVVLLIAAITGLMRIRHRAAGTIAITLVASIGVFGGRYLIGFVRDCRPVTSRLLTAEKIRTEIDGGAHSIAMWVEPAPYSMPPVDLFRCRLLLLPRGTRFNAEEYPADLCIPPADATLQRRSPAISWADRVFSISLKPSAEAVGDAPGSTR